MFTSLRIQNFKAWKDTGTVRLAPLTIIFGANSAGKSSLGHLLLALKQTAISTDRKRALHLGDDNSIIELGTFKECLHNQDVGSPLRFELGWNLPEKLTVQDAITRTKFVGDQMQINASLLADAREQPYVEEMRYELKSGQDIKLDVTYQKDDQGTVELRAGQFRLVRSAGRVWPLDKLDKFYRLSDQSRAKFQNADFLTDFALHTEAALANLYYLGPLRDHPKRIYSWSGETPESVGAKGEFTIAAILAAKAEGRELSLGYRKRNQPFDGLVARWLKDLGVISNFSVKPVAEGRKEYEVLVKTQGSRSEVKISDVGFGVSQVLPALVQSFYCPPNSTVWMEQPEIHLHPQVQAELADVFIAAIHARENGRPRNTQLIIESHSEHFLNRIQRRVAEGNIEVEDVAIYFCNRAGTATEIEPLKLNIFGEIENWPEDFFGDEMADIAARVRAAMQKKMIDKADSTP